MKYIYIYIILCIYKIHFFIKFLFKLIKKNVKIASTLNIHKTVI